MTLGFYEQLITKLISTKLDILTKKVFFIKETEIKKAEN